MFVFFLTFLASFLFLVFEFIQRVWPDGKRRYPFKKIALLFAGIAVLSLLLTWGNYTYVRGKLEELTDVMGVRREWAWAATLFVSGTLSFLFAKSVSLSRRNRRIGGAGVASLVAAFYVLTWFGSRDNPIGMCIAWDESGVRSYNTLQIDPPTGEPCIVITPENVGDYWSLATRENAVPKRKFAGPFFTQKSGSDVAVPLAWYSRTDDGDIEMWDFPSVHPTTGERLRQVTPEVAREWVRQESSRKGVLAASPGADTGSGSGQAKSPDSTAGGSAPMPTFSTGAGIANLRQRYIGQITAAGGKAPRWTVVAWSAEGVLDPRMAGEIEAIGTSVGLPKSRALFSEAFVTDHAADRVLRGDRDLLKVLGIGKHIDYVVLAQVQEKLLEEREPDWQVVEASVHLQVVHMGDSGAASAIQVTQAGGGLSQRLARGRAHDRLVDDLNAQVKPVLKGFLR